MNDPWGTLIASDPSDSGFAPAEGLRDRILAQPVEKTDRRGLSFWRKLSRGILVLVGALAVGAAVSWAATGKDPLDRFERIWGIDRNAGLSADRSGYGLGEFAVMEPMADDPVAELPEAVKHWLALVRMVPPPAPTGAIPDDYVRPPMKQAPGRIAGWGETTTDAGEKVGVISMNGKVCLIFDRYHGGNCGTIAQIERTGIATTMRDGENPAFRGTIGLVPDSVTSLRIDYPGYGEVPVRDNVFRAADIPEDRFFMIGRDKHGNVTTRVFVAKPLTPAQERFIERAPEITKRRALRRQRAE